MLRIAPARLAALALAAASMWVAGSSDHGAPVLSPEMAAEGFGADSIGGEGGRIIWVTNLNDSGPGSLREALTAQGPRVVRFKVGGIIPLSGTIVVEHGALTLDGASAADQGGITLFGHGIVLSGLECRDVIVRHIRVRRAARKGEDCLGVERGAHRVLFDRCSVSWADDESIGITRGHYITVQWCIISDGYVGDRDPRDVPSFGMLVAHGANHVTVHHNLFVGSKTRNALFYGVGGPGSGGAVPGTYPGEEMAVFMPIALFDFRNNLVYNFRMGTQLDGGAHVNVVGNCYRNSERWGEPWPVAIETKTYYPGSEQPRVFCRGNIGPQHPQAGGDEWALVSVDMKRGADGTHRSDRPFLVPPVATQSAQEAADLVVQRAGAYPRDEVDACLIEEYRTRAARSGCGYLEWKQKHGL